MLQSSVYEHLKNAILAGELDFDTIYSETKVASSLSVSRTPVRDAVMRLHQERYVDILPSRGFMLHKPTMEDLRLAHQIRSAVETYCALALYAERESPAARRCIASMRDYCLSQARLADDEVGRFWQLDIAFHRQIVGYVKNETFDTLINNYMHFFTAMPVSSFITDRRKDSTIREHMAMLEAIESGTQDEVREAVQRHTDESLATILHMQRESSQKAREA
ncbi:MAG: GntR family transcriptional regulator [Clostridia bacterium]|nr:GntR family transcriptional regulator [Clostridia bacterium]